MRTKIDNELTVIERFALPVPYPDGWTIKKNKNYYRLGNAHAHPISDSNGCLPYHRWILFEKLLCPAVSRCHWCEYILPWKHCGVKDSMYLIVNCDHLDKDPYNNSPSNLVPACFWCNMNRGWADKFPEFWANWKRWMATVQPCQRPYLRQVAKDCGLDVPDQTYKTEPLPEDPSE